jgi:hypothetical protein
MSGWSEIRKRFPGKTGACSKGALVKLFISSAGLGEKARVLNHLVSCPECRASFLALLSAWGKGTVRMKAHEIEVLQKMDGMSLRSWACRTLPGLQALEFRTPKRTLFPRQAALAGLGIATLLLVTSGILFFGPGGSSPDRKSDGQRTGRANPISELLSAPIVFSWNPVAGARDYRLEILPAGFELFSAVDAIAAVGCIIPGEILERIRARQSIFRNPDSPARDGSSRDPGNGRFMAERGSGQNQPESPHNPLGDTEKENSASFST